MSLARKGKLAKRYDWWRGIGCFGSYTLTIPLPPRVGGVPIRASGLSGLQLGSGVAEERQDARFSANFTRT